jgi:hypothetical protein
MAQEVAREFSDTVIASASEAIPFGRRKKEWIAS